VVSFVFHLLVHIRSYGASIIYKRTVLVDLEGSDEEIEVPYGTQFVGGVRVVPKPTIFADWDWSEISCYTEKAAEPILISTWLC